MIKSIYELYEKSSINGSVTGHKKNKEGISALNF